MRKTSLALAVAASTLGLSQVAFADLVGDTKVSLEARNFYFNRDFREGAGQSKQEEWAQGFILRMNSGFTEGTVGFGADAIGMYGFKLDSGDGTAGSGLLVPDRSSGGSQDNYSGLAVAAKAKVSNSTLRVGHMQFKNAAIASSDSRLLPQIFRGGHLVSQEIEGLTLDAGYLDEVNNRNSQDYEDMTLNTYSFSGIQFRGLNQSNEFIFAGGNYKLTNDLTAGYYYSNLEDMYKQHSFNLVHVLPLGDKQSLKTDLRYARSTDDGQSNVDNKAFGAMVTYALSGHSFGIGYQQMDGDTGFAYVGGTDPFLVNYVQIGNFAAKDEKSWQARYDFNFASIGIPGLTFMTRYLTGDNIDRGAGVSEGREWERNTDIAYVFQEGALKNLGLRWRNATMRNNFSRNIDENRLIVSYTLPLM
ncbi:OprD family porin [Ectopseudomonas chengduensis]|uniref:Outer membrane porin, OprD family n=1 Tax=Ectopseudomonas toyotomiensis TaxID=554344 RepID=A0A1I5YL23_9GAMM|nr:MULTISPECIES: OprD family porin [Pseudomonas]PIA67915.1 outer membrane porin, OprD family [Pseudomonas toyotomiensis]SDA71786.1 outer membrane porin, OprD family [Pseudomonas sp. NFPP33]SFQ44959.1 outer membrane porin, OprD family [Pseudomonas toyotomiensis]